MEDRHTHKIVHRRLRRGSTVFEPGDEITPTDAELRAFGDNLIELTPETAVDQESIEDELATGDHPTPEEFTEMSVREYRSYVADHDVSAEYMQAMLDAEQATEEPRSTVTTMLEQRIDRQDGTASDE